MTLVLLNYLKDLLALFKKIVDKQHLTV